MACTALSILTRICPPQSMGGVKKLYAIAYDDLVPYTDGKVYKLTNGIISDIGVDDITFVEVGVVKNTASLEEKLTRNVSTNIRFYTQTLKVILTIMSTDVIDWIENVLGRNVTVIMQDMNLTYWLVGADGKMELTEEETVTGTTENDMNGYTLTFSGTTRYKARMIDPSLVRVLIGEGGTYTPAPPTPKFTAYWGWVDSPSDITDAGEVEALQYNGQFNVNTNVTADYRQNSLPKFLVMAEPLSQPLKTKWYGDVFNQGHIGDDDNDLFGTPQIIGQYRVYMSVYETIQTQTAIQFKVN